MLRRLTCNALVTLLLVCAAGFSAWSWISHRLDAPLGIDGEEYLLVVEKGSSLSTISRRLQADGLIDSRYPLAVYARCCASGVVHAGEYLIAKGESARGLLHKLLSGDVLRYKITFPEGKALTEWLAIAAGNDTLASQGVPDIEGLAALIDNRGTRSPEGWFFPDTYTFVRGDDALQVFRQAHEKMERVLAEEWEKRAPGLPFKTPYEALILASIVEKETGVPEERSMIAGVFVRRLEKNMRLQTDPSVIYGLGVEFDGNLTRAHLARKTPYNTYLRRGLPPTPIANPGQEAIHAVLHPDESGNLFFVAKGDGSHYFSATLAEHLRAVRRFQLNRKEDYRSSPGPN